MQLASPASFAESQVASIDWARMRGQVRAGAGGEEAALWAADLMRMYQKYAIEQGWKMSEISSSEAENGGYKEIVMQVRVMQCCATRHTHCSKGATEPQLDNLRAGSMYCICACGRLPLAA